MLSPYVFQAILVSNISVIIICFMVIFFTINRSKVFSNISHILHNMIRKYDSAKPPKNKKEFWKIFCDFNNNVKVELDKQITGWKYWVPIGLSIGVALSMVNVTILIGYGIIHPPPEYIKAPSVIATGNVYRYNDTESHLIRINSNGDKSVDNLRIEVYSPPNITIWKIEYKGGILLTNKTEWYNLNFSKPNMSVLM